MAALNAGAVAAVMLSVLAGQGLAGGHFLAGKWGNAPGCDMISYPGTEEKDFIQLSDRVLRFPDRTCRILEHRLMPDQSVELGTNCRGVGGKRFEIFQLFRLTPTPARTGYTLGGTEDRLTTLFRCF